MRNWTPLLLVLLPMSDLGAQSPKRLWVLQAPDQLVESDLATFAPQAAITFHDAGGKKLRDTAIRVRTAGDAFFR